MRHVLIADSCLDGEFCILDRGATHHLTVVLRTRIGEELVLTDGQGHLRRAVFDRLDGKFARCRFISDVTVECRRLPSITLFQCIAKPARMDWLVEKAAELGTDRIVPIISDHCAVKMCPGEKIDRWERIAISALEQCGGSHLMVVDAPVRFREAIPQLLSKAPSAKAGSECAFAGIIGSTSVPILSALSEIGTGIERVNWIVGPEGDFSSEEISIMLGNGIVPVGLGDKILRVETAAVFGLSVIRAFFEARAL